MKNENIEVGEVNPELFEIETIMKSETYAVECVYKIQAKDTTPSWSTKTYTFVSDKNHFEGELVVVEDVNGYSLVKVVNCYTSYATKANGYKSVVNLDEVNNIAKAKLRKQEVAVQIRTAIVTQLENNAFDMLISQHPNMAPLIEEYKKSGGNYSELMPTLANMKA